MSKIYTTKKKNKELNAFRAKCGLAPLDESKPRICLKCREQFQSDANRVCDRCHLNPESELREGQPRTSRPRVHSATPEKRARDLANRKEKSRRERLAMQSTTNEEEIQ